MSPCEVPTAMLEATARAVGIPASTRSYNTPHNKYYIGTEHNKLLQHMTMLEFSASAEDMLISLWSNN